VGEDRQRIGEETLTGGESIDLTMREVERFKD
jgi:hypothetical protein